HQLTGVVKLRRELVVLAAEEHEGGDHRERRDDRETGEPPFALVVLAAGLIGAAAVVPVPLGHSSQASEEPLSPMPHRLPTEGVVDAGFLPSRRAARRTRRACVHLCEGVLGTEPRQPSRGVTVAVAIALAGLLAWAGLGASQADARRAYTPAKGKIWHGTSDTGEVADYRRFNKQVRHHTPLLQTFYHWGVPLTTGALDRWRRTGTRGVLSLSTAPGGKAEVITPRAIAMGRDDHYMLRLNQSIANSGQVVYIRPFAEMNLHYNPYSAYNADGSLRSNAHRKRWYKLAWRRLVTIVRGGPRKRINR